jgi:3-deoxy-manno-octulosonate cytidylyltransferase (CMP-KDO synthetase)
MTAEPVAPVQGFHVIIPARLASTRLPNKPLADIGGQPMVVRVAQQALRSQATSVTVAADHPSIVEACQAAGIAAVLTDAQHPSGSDRLAQACALLQLSAETIVVNVQGDEPLIAPALINAVSAQLQARPDCVMSTAAHPIMHRSEFDNPNVVKVVLDHQHTALYFSRAPIPLWRDAAAGQLPAQPQPLRHVGIYGYRVGFLQAFPTLSPAPIEQCESLEQLRVLWHGQRIAVHITPEAPGRGVDTPEDLEAVRALWAQQAPGV